MNEKLIYPVRLIPRFLQLLCCLLTGAVLGGANGQGEGIMAGFSQRVISPPVAMTNWVTQRPYARKLDELLVRAAVLSDGTNRFVLLSWDLVDAREGAVREARQAIESRLGIPGGQVLVQATHTHSAPWSPPFDSPLLVHERNRIETLLGSVEFEEWRKKLLNRSVEAVRAADERKRPVRLHIGYAWGGDLAFNRRPRKPGGQVETLFTLEDPHVLPGGLRFHVTDPVISAIAFKSGDEIAGLWAHFACHPVAVYPFYDGLSADWPGAWAEALQEETGGAALFLQGCAGDLVPARRGIEASREMGRELARRTAAAARQSAPLDGTRIRTGRRELRLPLMEMAAVELGQSSLSAEVQALSIGEVALVTLPGEPLIDLGLAIQQRSPFPHTLVLGYANGYGVGYVGVPGEKERGGYEAGRVAAGKDECGELLIEAAVELLNEMRADANSTND
jgi:neutral ceramidase